MRRLNILALFAFGLSASAYSQLWEKLVVPGLSYRLEIDNGTNRQTHILRFSPGANGLTMRPEVAGGKVYALPADKGRETVTEMVKRTGAVAGINADFFPFTADPLGAMVREGEIFSRPDPRRSLMAWGEHSAVFTRLNWSAKAVVGPDRFITINGLNEECGENQVVLSTNAAAKSLASAPCIHLVLRVEEGKWAPTSKREAAVERVVEGEAELTVEPGYVVLTGRGSRVTELRSIAAGTKLTIDMQTVGVDWRIYKHVVSGGPNLLTKGKVDISAEPEGFKGGFETNRHPRTALGRNAQGDIFLVAVDGRQSMSVGATLEELASIMAKLGCSDAINLDGGGSTAINVGGLTLNRPSDGTERKVANAVLIFAEKPTVAAEDEFVLEKITKPNNPRFQTLRIVTKEGKAMRDAEVFWAAQGAAWIDQGGNLTWLQPGTATVSAYVRGKVITQQLELK